MSTVPLPVGGSIGKISYTRKGSTRTTLRSLPPALILSPRSSTGSIPRVSSPPGSSSSTGYDLGPVAESPISDHAVFGSSSSILFGRSSGLDEAPIPVSGLPALPDDNVPGRGGLVSMVDSDNVPIVGSNAPARRDTDGGNVIRIESADAALPIICIAPFDVNGMKYCRSIFYPPDASGSIISKLEPGKRKFKRPGIPRGWKAHECPEGKLYFHHKSRRLLTMIDIENDQNRRQIERAGDDLLSQLASMDAPDDAEMTLMKTEDAIGYYVASMADQCVFWFKEVDVSLVTNGDRAVVSEMHLEKAIREQFWQHVEMFPNHRGLPRVAIRELKDTFAYGLCDYVTSQTSMFAYDPDTIEKLSKCMAGMKEDEINPANTAAAARLLNTIYKERFLHFHGEIGARLDRKESAFKADIRGPRSFIFICISPFLFFMPFVYLKELERTYVDNSVHYYFWRQFIEGLKRDWENSITPATVLLSANVGFLAINSIDTTSPNKSAAQISSYISSIFSLFIYIVAQILSRHHRHHNNGQAHDALQYILKREDRLIGLQGVAIAFSLPTALFLWSMVTFLVALMFVFFADSSVATKVAMGVIVGFMAVVVILLLYLESEGTIAEQSPLPRGWALLAKTLRSFWERWSNKDLAVGGSLRLRKRKHVKEESLASTVTLSSLPGP
ncbi:uncharacterized protein PHACADRAFT_252136 [Phanerochaete carnosa HHB-10118-sp]|uniref:WW domain-containing protein n=1 Tax=Phanerochaete carnosa (strain HHB-10118-sp) TaxID=650164 RepID=K5WG76_PHACS|nr:uncharacterized protein PHACADRAFT_252136 [Phanerochaete carnosa HHB-10118-sp]EKM58104.1 hypothetical protein PHACADRAFT_252136 [Phanerochaete carnosa HHB-10118-sp]